MKNILKASRFLPAAILLSLLLTLTACSSRTSTAGNEATERSTPSVPPAAVSEATTAPVTEATPAPAAETAPVTETGPSPEAETFTEEEMYPYYAALSDAQKTVYRQIVTNVQNGVSEMTPEANVTEDEFQQTLDAVYREQPQLFWMDDAWHGSYNTVTGYIASVTVEFNSLSEDLEKNVSAFQNAAERALAGTEGLSAIETEKAAHDYIVQNTTYGTGSLDQTAYSALVDGVSVCEGYTRAFQYLMQCAGVPAYVAEGTAQDLTTGETDSHAWNILKLGDGYYNVDVTWDDTMLEDTGLISYTYYNQTDAVFSSDHFRSAEAAVLPVCDAGEYTFESVYSLPAALGATMQLDLTARTPLQSLQEYYAAMENALVSAGTGSHTFTFIVSGEQTMNDISDALSSGAIKEGFVTKAASSLGLNGYSYSTGGSTLSLGRGYYLLTQDVTLQ